MLDFSKQLPGCLLLIINKISISDKCKQTDDLNKLIMIIYPPLQYPLVLHRLERGIALYSDKQQLFRRPARVFETNGSGLKTLGNASDGAMITLESGWIFYTHPTTQHIHYTYTHILWTYTHNNNCYQNCDITKLLLLKKKYTS